MNPITFAPKLQFTETHPKAVQIARGIIALFFLYYFALIIFQGNEFFENGQIFQRNPPPYWSILRYVGIIVAGVALAQTFFGRDSRLALLVCVGIFANYHMALSADQAGKYLFMLVFLTLPLLSKFKLDGVDSNVSRSLPFLLFLAIFYFVVGLDKINEQWGFSGNPLQYVGQTPALSTKFGQWLLSINPLNRILGVGVLLIELALAPLILLSICSIWARWVVFVSLIFIHLGILLTMDIGYFPIFNLATCILVFPTKKVKVAKKNFSIFIYFIIFLSLAELRILKINPKDVDLYLGWDLISRPYSEIDDIVFRFQSREKSASSLPELLSLKDKPHSLFSGASLFYGPIWHFFFLNYTFRQIHFTQSEFGKYLGGFIEKMCNRGELNAVEVEHRKENFEVFTFRKDCTLK